MNGLEFFLLLAVDASLVYVLSRLLSIHEKLVLRQLVTEKVLLPSLHGQAGAPEPEKATWASSAPAEPVSQHEEDDQIRARIEREWASQAAQEEERNSKLRELVASFGKRSRTVSQEPAGLPPTNGA